MKKTAIEKIDEAIEKLENKGKEKVKEKSKDKKIGKAVEKKKEEKQTKNSSLEKTKEFKKLDETDTKIFNYEEVDKKNCSKEDTKVCDVLENKDEETTEEFSFDNLDDREMSNTFIDENPKKFVTKRKMKKKAKILLVFGIIFVLLVSLVIGCIVIKGKDAIDKDTSVEKVLSEDDKEKLITKFGTDLEKVITDEFSINKKILTYEEAIKLVKTEEKIKCSIYEIYDDGKIYLNKCSINGIMTKYSYGEEQEIIDNDLIIYVEKSSNKATLTKPSASNEPLYEEYKVDCGDIYSDPYLLNEYMTYVVYFDSNGLVQIKNFKTDEKVLSNLDYTEVVPIKLNNTSYDTKKVAVLVGDFWGIYDFTGEQIISPMYTKFLPNLLSNVGARSSISVVSGNMIVAYDGKNYGIIDYTSNKTIISFEYKKFYLNGNYIIGLEQADKRHLFDLDGNEYFSGDNVYGVVEDKYFLVEQDGSVNLAQIDGKKLYEYGIINNIGEFFFGKVSDQKVVFQFFDLNSTGKCINITYDMSSSTGIYTSENVCGN